MGLLKGRALAWAEAFNAHQTVTSLTFHDFVSEFRRVFDHHDRNVEAARRLLQLLQGSQSAAEFSMEFHTSNVFQV